MKYYIDHRPALATPSVVGRPDLACRAEGVNPEWFYPGAGGSASKALAVCVLCPAIDECRDWAIRTGQQFGVWGGTTAEDRDRLRHSKEAA